MCIALVVKLAAWVEVQSWEAVPAQVHFARLVEHVGDDSTTYSVEARYSYTVDGAEYTGTRVGLYEGADNVGSFNQRVAEELESHANSAAPFIAYYDPDAPSESVLYRELRPELVLFYSAFAFVFGGFGTGVLVVAWAARKRAARTALRREERPDAPWLWNEEWRTGILKSSNRSRMLVAVGFASFWNAISIPIAVGVLMSLDVTEEPAGLMVLIFPLVGLGLAYWAVRAFVQWRKFGETTLQLAGVPIELGGTMDGVVRLPAQVFPAKGFDLRLDCVRLVTTGSGKNRSTSEHILWQDAVRVGPERMLRDALQSAVPVSFRMPHDQPETGRENMNPFWRLVVTAELPGVDFYADFKVPVFGRAAAQNREETITSVDDAGSPVAETGAMPLFSVPVQTRGDGPVSVHFPRARHLGVAFGLLVFFLVWTGSTVFMVVAGAPMVFPVVFGFFDLLIGLFLLDLLFSERHAEARPGELVLSGGLFGLGAQKRFSADEVRIIEAARGMQAGSKVYYTLRAESADGRKHTIGARLESQQEANAIARLLQEALFR